MPIGFEFIPSLSFLQINFNYLFMVFHLNLVGNSEDKVLLSGFFMGRLHLRLSQGCLRGALSTTGRRSGWRYGRPPNVDGSQINLSFPHLYTSVY